MAGKFSLLTVLTLNASGYNKGIEQAKASTTSLVKGTEQASNAIKGSFGKLAGLTAPLMSSMGMLPGVIGSGIGAFRAMIPAITGVKMAIVSTGIGAIVIAIGIAFAALTTYLTGTSEGANKLKLIFSYVSGAVTVLMQRIKYLGAAIFDLLTGDFKKLQEDLKAAFASGFMDEVIEGAKENNRIQAQEIELGKQKRNLLVEEANTKKQIAELNYKARNQDEETKEGAKEKLVALKQEIGLIDKLYADKIRIATLEFNIQKAKNELKGKDALTGDDKTALAEKEAAIILLQAEAMDTKSSQMRLMGKLQNQIGKESDDLAKDEEKRIKTNSDLISLRSDLAIELEKETSTSTRKIRLSEVEQWKKDELDKINSVKATTTEQIEQAKLAVDEINKLANVKKNNVNNEENLNDNKKLIDGEKEDLESKKALLEGYYKLNLISVKDYFSKKKSLEESLKKNDLDDLKNELDQRLITREDFEKKRKAIIEKYRLQGLTEDQANAKIIKDTQLENQAIQLQGFSDIAGAAGSFFDQQTAEYKAFAIAQSLISTYLAAQQVLSNPLLLDPVTKGISMAAVIAMGLTNVAKISGFENGGIIGGSSYTGDKVLAKVNSGEMILNRKQQSNLFSIANNGGSNGFNNEVVFTIKGNTLVGVLQNQSKRINNFR